MNGRESCDVGLVPIAEIVLWLHLNVHQLKVIVGVLDLRIHYVWHVKSLSAFQGWNVTK